MKKKYIMTDDIIDLNGHTLHRIKAVKDFGNVIANELGGYIESENNLSHDGSAWVAGNAKVSGDALVTDDAFVTDDAWVTGNAKVTGNASVANDTDLAVIRGFGRFNRTTTFFRCKDNIVRCQCGCFYRTINEFRAQVQETHGDNKFAKEYLMIADLMELHFNKGE